MCVWGKLVTRLEVDAFHQKQRRVLPFAAELWWRSGSVAGDRFDANASSVRKVKTSVWRLYLL